MLSIKVCEFMPFWCHQVLSKKIAFSYVEFGV